MIALAGWQSLSLQLVMTFAHFLWQGALVGVALAVSLRLCSRQSANTRYVVASIAFALLPLSVAGTFAVVHHGSHSIVDTQLAPVISESNSASLPALAELERPETVMVASQSTPVPLPPLEQVSQAAVPVVDSKFTWPLWSSWLLASSTYMIGLYIVGVATILVRLSRSVWIGAQIRWAVGAIEDSAITQVFTEQAARMGLKRVPVLGLSDQVSVPVVVGILKPTILLPPAILCGLDPQQIAAILSHEMAHIRRYDLLINLMQRLVEALLFFHPVTWWISRRMSIEREDCCDDMAVAGCGRLEFAGALLRMAELCAENRGLSIGPQLEAMAADGGSPSQLTRRVHRLLGETSPPRLVISRMSLVAAIAIVLLSAASAFAVAQTIGASTMGDANDPDETVSDSDSAASANPPQTGTHRIDDPRAAKDNAMSVVEPSFRLPEHRSVKSICFHSKTGQLASLAWEGASDRDGLRVTVRTWDVVNRKRVGEVELQWEPGWSRSAGNLILSDDASKVVGLLDGEIGVWDTATGGLVKRHPIPEDIKTDNRYSVSLSHLVGTPDLSRIAFGRAVSLGGLVPDAYAVVMETVAGGVIQKIELKHGIQVRSLALSVDGQRLATVASGSRASIWDVSSGERLLEFNNSNLNRTHPDPRIKSSVSDLVSCVGFSSDGKTLAVSDMLGVKLIDSKSGKLVHAIDAPYRYLGSMKFVFSSDDRLVTLLGAIPEDGEPRRIALWSTQTGEIRRILPGDPADAAFSMDGQWFATGQSDLKEAIAIWQIRDASGGGVTTRRPATPVDDAQANAGEIERPAAQFTGKVLGPDGQPLSGADVYVISAWNETTQLGPVRAVSDAEGQFTFDAADMTWQRMGATMRRGGLIVAKKDGFVPEWMETWGNNRGVFSTGLWGQSKRTPIELQLARDDVPIRGQLLDADGRALVGARVRLTRMMVPRKRDLTAFLEHWSKAHVTATFMTGISYQRELDKHFELMDLKSEYVTDQEGRIELSGIGRDRIVHLEIMAPNIVTTNVSVMTRDTPDVGILLDGFEGKGNPTQTVYGANFSIALKPGLTVTGIVRDRDSKRPVSGMWVTTGGYSPLTAPQHTKDVVVTAKDGRFTIHGLDPKLLEYEKESTRSISAIPQPGVQYLRAGTVFKKNQDTVIETVRGINYRLTVVNEQGQPVEATVEYRRIHPNSVGLQMITSVGGGKAGDFNRATRQKDGAYVGFVLPGPGAVTVSVPGSEYRPANVDPKEFFEPGRTWDDESFSTYGTHNSVSLGGSWLNQREYEAIVLVNPKKDSGPLELAATLIRDRPRTISLIDSDGKPLAGATARMHERHGPSNVNETIAGSSFPLKGLNVDKDLWITFIHDGRKLADVRAIRGDDDAGVIVKMRRWGAVKGRFVDENGTPVVINGDSEFSTIVRNEAHGAKEYFAHTVDESGKFQIEGFAAGQSYSSDGTYRKRKNYIPGGMFQRLVLRPGEVRDLGDIVVQLPAAVR